MTKLDNKITTDVERAAHDLIQGKLVAFPTETVYGLGGDAMNVSAINQIFSLKKRPVQNSLIVHIHEVKQLADWAEDIPQEAYLLAEAFWPGPLTLILPKKVEVPFEVSGGKNTIALRIPAHPLALQLLRVVNRGIAGPSANQYTRISPTTAQAVAQEFGAKIDLILDGGPCDIGLESTIVNLCKKAPEIIRPGMISAQAIESVLAQEVSIKPTTPHYPGNHFLHYAPRTETYLVHGDKIDATLKQWDGKPIGVISLAQPITAQSQLIVRRLSMDPRDYARAIYQTLRELDDLNLAHILIELPPQETSWVAILDRLTKAAAGKLII